MCCLGGERLSTRAPAPCKTCLAVTWTADDSSSKMRSSSGGVAFLDHAVGRNRRHICHQKSLRDFQGRKSRTQHAWVRTVVSRPHTHHFQRGQEVHRGNLRRVPYVDTAEGTDGEELFETLLGGSRPFLSASAFWADWQLISASVKKEMVSTGSWRGGTMERHSAKDGSGS